MRKALLYKAGEDIKKIKMFDQYYNRNVYLEDGHSYTHTPGDEIKGIKLFRQSITIHQKE